MFWFHHLLFELPSECFAIAIDFDKISVLRFDVLIFFFYILKISSCFIEKLKQSLMVGVLIISLFLPLLCKAWQIKSLVNFSFIFYKLVMKDLLNWKFNSRILVIMRIINPGGTSSTWVHIITTVGYIVGSTTIVSHLVLLTPSISHCNTSNCQTSNQGCSCIKVEWTLSVWWLRLRLRLLIHFTLNKIKLLKKIRLRIQHDSDY